ncbi:MAG TPA: hypothetical protein QGG47_14085 [Acidobacteriota bacterium]|nr:hypothetical protein [Acidobacteriota bacterium]
MSSESRGGRPDRMATGDGALHRVAWMMIGLAVAAAGCQLAPPAPEASAGPYANSLLPLRERVEVAERWTQWKREHVLPMVMREQGVDLWIIRDNEADLYYNNEGPVYSSLVPADLRGMIFDSQYGGSKPAFLLFHDTGDEIEYAEPRDYDQVGTMVAERDPDTIAISSWNNEPMLAALGGYADRSIDSWTLGVRWYETVSPEMIERFRDVVGLANEIIAEGFSSAAVTPDVSTTDDLNWWFRQKMLDLGIEHENHPSISIQRSLADIDKYDDPMEYVVGARTRNDIDVVIRRGDVLRVDTDVFMFGLVTDTHQYAYVLREGETEVPAELVDALDTANAIQDQFATQFKVGRTGKEIVAASEALTFPDNLAGPPTNDFHPPPKYMLRFHRDGWMLSTKTAVVGMTSGPGYASTSIVTNDHALHTDTLYAFEPHIDVTIDGWGEQGLELGHGQIVAFTENGFEFLNRAPDWHVIR